MSVPANGEVADTIPDELAESATFDTHLPVMPTAVDTLAIGWAHGRWVLSRQQLSQLPGITLLEVIERLPGIVGFRAGGFGRPEGLTAMGFGGSRVRVLVDGIEMDPIGSGLWEIETFPLIDIERVEVERNLDGLRISISTFELAQPEAHSVIKLGTGVYQTRLLDAIFSRGIGDNSALTGVFDLASTRGVGVNEPYSHSTATFRYSYALGSSSGVEVQWMQQKLDRRGTLLPRQTSRKQLSLIARSRLNNGIVLQASAARIGQQEESETAGLYDLSTNQLHLGATYGGEQIGAELSARLHPGSSLNPSPRLADGSARFTIRPGSALELSARGGVASHDGATAALAGATAVLAPVDGLSVFLSAVQGSTFLPLLVRGVGDSFPQLEASDAIVRSNESGLRGGFDATLSGIRVGLAGYRNGNGTLQSFELPFDEDLSFPAGGDVDSSIDPITAVEGYLDAPVPGTAGILNLNGWYTRSLDGQSRPYTPVEAGRAGLWAHGNFYGGQFQPSARLEYLYQGPALVPNDLQSPTGYATFRRSQTLHFSLRLRILDVEAFLLWNNLLSNQTAIQIPGSPPAFPRIVYGAEWLFRN